MLYKQVSHYQLNSLLRRDGFGAVYLGEDVRTQKAVVLRVIELDHQTLARITGRVRARSQREHPLIEQIRQRMKQIAELKNSHILSVLEYGEEHLQETNDIIFYMASPFEKGNLLSYWSEYNDREESISLEVVAELLNQASLALLYIHKRGLVHQYVRLSSFILRSSARSRRLHLLLTDFWFADITMAILGEGQLSQDLSIYSAPEQLNGRAVPASDQYALAVLIYELLLGYRLSVIDCSLGLYERFLLQRSSEISLHKLEIARRIDQVLLRALAELPQERFSNISEFAALFYQASRGEALELEADTTLTLAAHTPGRKSAASLFLETGVDNGAELTQKKDLDVAVALASE
ncbi:MAG TPA: protein kinase, partial [Ktedonobacteraceae bacterium]|nr:protein kinase [Ktedonobacteraceae bacterium]